MDMDSLKDWTRSDKLLLYRAIRAHGSYNIDQLQECIPDKTTEEIEEALSYFRKKVIQQNTPKITESHNKSQTPYVPLNKWAKLLTETFDFNDLRTETATALRLIADFEDIPLPICTEKIDFKKVYHTLANALEGKALCEDKLVAAVIDKCIVETALTSKAFMKCSIDKNVIKEIRINERDLGPFMKPTENNQLSVIRHIAMHKNYNPLNISEQHLKFSLFH